MSSRAQRRLNCTYSALFALVHCVEWLGYYTSWLVVFFYIGLDGRDEGVMSIAPKWQLIVYVRDPIYRAFDSNRDGGKPSIKSML